VCSCFGFNQKKIKKLHYKISKEATEDNQITTGLTAAGATGKGAKAGKTVIPDIHK
jgi:hypothetical protein